MAILLVILLVFINMNSNLIRISFSIKKKMEKISKKNFNNATEYSIFVTLLK